MMDVLGEVTVGQLAGIDIIILSTILSDDQRNIFRFVHHGFISNIVVLFGTVANIINIIIFYKQGFRNTVNIGFFGLAISDMCCLIALFWASVCMNPLFAESSVPWLTAEVAYLTGSWPHHCFARITSFITVYLTAERYLSIALPLKVKHIITPKITTTTICLIYLVNLMTLVPEYITSYLGWRFVSSKNKTLLALLFTSTRTSFEGIVFILHSLLGMSSFAAVIIFTSLLVTKLGQSSKWRNVVTSNQDKSAAISNRDRKTVKMVVLIATVLIVCYTPGAIISWTSFIVGPEFNIKGRYYNLVDSMWAMAFSIQGINSSVNIFLYYTMSSKYRETFHQIIVKRGSLG